jgi:hypothetical protein
MNRIVPSLFMLALVGGCSGGLDQQSAVKVMGAALTGTGAAQQKLMPASMTSAGATFDGQVQNTAGTGSAQVTGSTTQSGSGWSLTFDIVYNHWTDVGSNVTLDGSLHESASFSTLSPLVGSVKISGALTASGAVQGAVDFDLSANYTATSFQISGNVGGSSVSASGSVSGG